MSTSFRGATFLMTAIVLAETLMHGMFASTDSSAPALAYFLLGLAIPLLAVLLRNKRHADSVNVPYAQSLLAISVVLLLFLWQVPSIFLANPIDHLRSDVIPVIMTMARRFVSGEPVYSIMTEFWGGTWPIYMPAMWLPYVLATNGSFDPRWISVAFLVIASVTSVRLWERDRRLDNTLLAALPICGMLAMLTSADIRLLTLSQEGVVVAYYVILATGIIYRNPYVTGIAAALCTFSRYSLAFWLITYMSYLLASRQYKYFTQVSIAGLATAILLMVPTGAIDHLRFFVGLDDVYLNAIRPNNEWKMSGTIYEGLGLARFWAYPDLRQLYKVFLVVNILVPVTAYAILYIRRHISLGPLAHLAILKLSLVCFYNFIIIPVPTLFYTSGFLSLALFYAWLQPGRSSTNP